MPDTFRRVHTRRGMGAEDFCTCDGPWPCRLARPHTHAAEEAFLAAENRRVLSWAANWYVTRRHVVEPGTTHAICSPYTTLWLEGRTVERHKVPAADTPEVMALKACGLCTRKAKP